MDFTGTGNSLNPVHPSVLRLIMDSLRYFVIDCHVDGFRFDLASALAREFYDVDRLSAFFDTIHQDPVLSQVKLIAEPWDVGPGGYQVGNFPILWTEWNGVYRDCVRDFWRGNSTIAEFAQRFTGSSDLYKDDGRRPFASINFVTAHDGFTLDDLVSYNEKHNEANGEGNRDGTDDNRSWNCGAEGPTDDPDVNALRERQMRNFLTTLFLSQGVPMLLGGDELARTQRGNNNAYCQDNELSWFDWELDDRRQRLLEFTRRLVHLRLAHPVFHRTQFLTGASPLGSGLPDSWWFRTDGRKMTRANWADRELHTVGLFLNGEEIPAQSRTGEHVTDESFVLLFNAHHEPATFLLPPRRFGAAVEVRALDRRARRRRGRAAVARARRGRGRGAVDPAAAPRLVGVPRIRGVALRGNPDAARSRPRNTWGMKVLVAYASKYGSTAEVAESIARVLRSRCVHADVRAAGEVEDIEGYDGVVLGGGIYVGRWHRNAQRFARHFADDLAALPVAVFALGPVDEVPEHRAGSEKQFRHALGKLRFTPFATRALRRGGRPAEALVPVQPHARSGRSRLGRDSRMGDRDRGRPSCLSLTRRAA